MESKGKFCYPEFTRPVLLLLQLLESRLPLLCRKPGACTPTDTARAQESTVPLKLLYLPRLLKLTVSHLGWLLLFHSCSTIAAQSAVLTARSPEFCAAEAVEVPLLRLLVSKAQAKIFSLIFCQCFSFWQSNLGNVVFRCHHRRGYGRRGNGVENQQTNDLQSLKNIFTNGVYNF